MTKALHEYELSHQKIDADANAANQQNNNVQQVSNQNQNKLVKEPSQEKELNDYVLIFKKSSKDATNPLPVINSNKNSNEGKFLLASK